MLDLAVALTSISEMGAGVASEAFNTFAGVNSNRAVLGSVAGLARDSKPGEDMVERGLKFMFGLGIASLFGSVATTNAVAANSINGGLGVQVPTPGIRLAPPAP